MEAEGRNEIMRLVSWRYGVMKMKHVLTDKQVKHPTDGNLSTVKPVCTCGWEGREVAEYNDDVFSRVRRQGYEHLKSVRDS